MGMYIHGMWGCRTVSGIYVGYILTRIFHRKRKQEDETQEIPGIPAPKPDLKSPSKLKKSSEELDAAKKQLEGIMAPPLQHKEEKHKLRFFKAKKILEDYKKKR